MLKLRSRAERGELVRPSFRMPGAPYTGWFCLGFLGLIVVLMAFADEASKIAFWSMPAVALALAACWRMVRVRSRV